VGSEEHLRSGIRSAGARAGRRLVKHGRRMWLLAGVVVAGVAAASTIASISLLPPSLHAKPIAFAVASTEMSVGSSSSAGDTPELSNLFPLTQWSAVLGEEMTSPELKTLIARQAGIPVSQLAIDGPLAPNLQRTQQEPTQQERSYQLLAEGDRYRITLQTVVDFAAMTITARAPSQAAARALALATVRAAYQYLHGAEAVAGTPQPDRVQVAQLQPVVITGGSGGHTLAVLVFVIAYLLWCGLMLLSEKLIRDLHVLRSRRERPPAASASGSQVAPLVIRSSIEGIYGDGPISGRRGQREPEWN
jgi:hypothetical protein